MRRRVLMVLALQAAQRPSRFTQALVELSRRLEAIQRVQRMHEAWWN
jgi:hypothetical protein